MYMRMYTAVDECGNQTMFEQFLRLVDTTNPELTIPADYTIECSETIVYDDASATDNCDSEVLIGLEEEIVPGDCPGSYQIKRTFTAMDDCDNDTSMTQTITVQDTQAPMMTAAADSTVECDGMGNVDALNAWLDNQRFVLPSWMRWTVFTEQQRGSNERRLWLDRNNRCVVHRHR